MNKNWGHQTAGLERRSLGLLATTLVALIAAGAQCLAAPVILVNRQSGQCVATPGSGVAPGAQMVQRPCQDTSSLGWTIQPVAGGSRIVSQFDGFCLGVANGSLADGAAVREQACNQCFPAQCLVRTLARCFPLPQKLSANHFCQQESWIVCGNWRCKSCAQLRTSQHIR